MHACAAHAPVATQDGCAQGARRCKHVGQGHHRRAAERRPAREGAPGASSCIGQRPYRASTHYTSAAQAAVNTTIVAGTLSPQRAQAMSARGRGIDAAGGQPYQAAALSLVFHSAHPFVPTLRADVRRFQVCCACKHALLGRLRRRRAAYGRFFRTCPQGAAAVPPQISYSRSGAQNATGRAQAPLCQPQCPSQHAGVCCPCCRHACVHTVHPSTAQDAADAGACPAGGGQDLVWWRLRPDAWCASAQLVPRPAASGQPSVTKPAQSRSCTAGCGRARVTFTAAAVLPNPSISQPWSRPLPCCTPLWL